MGGFLEGINAGVVNMSSFSKPEGRQLVQFFRWLAKYVVQPKQMQEWRMSSDSRIDLMSCSVASSQAGLELVRFLENLTGVNWCASSRKVGGSHDSDDGFNWILDTDSHVGSVASHYFDVAKVEKWGQTLPKKKSSGWGLTPIGIVGIVVTTVVKGVVKGAV